MLKGDEQSGAIFSTCEKYRYQLWRKWRPGERWLVACCLNCSTADEHHNDPTVARCVKRAQMWGYDGFMMLNLFAYRSTDPAGLLAVEDPVGEHNDMWIALGAKYASTFLCAWGTASKLVPARSNQVLRLLSNLSVPLHYLALTKDGVPVHPLYRPYSETPKLWMP